MSSFNIQSYTFQKVATRAIMWIEYKFFQTTGRVVVQFLSEAGEILDVQYVDIPADVYAAWTDTDQYMVDYVCKELRIILSSLS